jgi:hypothetical protein
MIHHLPEGNLMFLIGRQLHRTYHAMQDNWPSMVIVALIIAALVIIIDRALTAWARESKGHKL